MATETTTKTYLINFDDNLDAYAQNAADAKREVDKLTASNKALMASGDASQAEIEQSNAALRTAQTEYKNATKLVDTATKARKAEVQSYEQLYRQWQLAQTQLKLMGDAYTVNDKGVRTLSQSYIDQSKKVDNAKKALDAFGKGVSDNRLNVGNYSGALDDMAGKLGMLPGGFGRAAQGASALGKQFMALLANPIVLLIAAITAALVGLFKAFKSTDTGADFLAIKMEQLRAIMDVVRQRAIALLGAIGSLLSGDFKKAGEQFAATFTGIGEQIEYATSAAHDYAMALDAIDESQKNYISKSADIRNEIAKLEFTAADRTKSTTEREKALRDALALDKEEADTRIKLAESTLNAELKYLADKTEGMNKVTEAEVLQLIRMSDTERQNMDDRLKTLLNNNRAKIDSIEELYAKFIDEDTRYFEENKRNQSKLTGFLIEIDKERKENAEIARVEKLRRDAESMNAEMRAQLTQIKTETDADITAVALREKQKDDLLVSGQQRRLERIKIESDAADALLATTFAGQLELERKNLETQYQMEIANAERVGADTTEIDERYARARVQIANIERDAKLELARGLASDIVNAVGESTALGKAAAIAMTTIDTFRGAQAAFTGMVSAIPGPVGIAAGIVAAAAAVAVGIANVKKILAVKTPKGGGGGGQTPSAGGTSMGMAASRVTAQPLGATTLQPVQSAADVQRQQQQQTLTADAIATAIGKLPAPVVTVEDINVKTTEKTNVEVRATV